MLKWLWLSIVVIVADQLTKYLATDLLNYAEPVAVIPFFNLTLLHNTGAAFSFLSEAGGWQRWFFASMAIGVSVGIGIWLSRLDSKQRWLAIALALIVGVPWVTCGIDSTLVMWSTLLMSTIKATTGLHLTLPIQRSLLVPACC